MDKLMLTFYKDPHIILNIKISNRVSETSLINSLRIADDAHREENGNQGLR